MVESFGTLGEHFERMFTPPGYVRPAETYGDIELSVQGSPSHYCSPREYLPNLGDYSMVEIAFFYKGKRVHPSVAGIDGFDDLFEKGRGPVAGYVPLAKVEELRQAIRGVV